jgi:hypothetical protein
MENPSKMTHAAHISEIFSNPPSKFTSLLPTPRLSNARKFHRDGGSAMCVESASISEHLLELYESVGIRKIVADYLGEAPCLSALKWVLRRPSTANQSRRMASGWRVYGQGHQQPEYVD